MTTNTKKIKLDELKKIVNKLMNELHYGSLRHGEDEYRTKIEEMFSEFQNKPIRYILNNRWLSENTTINVQVATSQYLGDKRKVGDELNVMDSRGTFNIAILLRLGEGGYVKLSSGYKAKEHEIDFNVQSDKLSPETVELIKEFIKRAGHITNLSEDLMISTLADLDNRVYSEDSEYNYPVDEASELKLDPQKFVNENNKKTKQVTVDQFKRIVKQLKK